MGRPTQTIKSEWLGNTSYAAGIERQQTVANCLAPNCIAIQGMEHPPTITLGRNPLGSTDLQSSMLELEKTGYQVVHAARGGRATVHAPGQLVIYPVARLSNLGLNVRDWVELLLNVTEKVVRFYGKTPIEAPCPGVYTQQGKIAFIGLRIERGVSTHGLSINVKNSEVYFRTINPCGTANQSLDFLGDDLELEEVYNKWVTLFRGEL